MRMGNGSDKSTQALVEETIAGSAEAFARLVDRYRDAASAVAYSYFGGFDDVQDAVQEAFVHAYCNLRQLREPAKFGPWLRKITANACAMALRKRERSEVSLDEVAEQQSRSDDARGIAAREIVQEALGKLSDATRLTVTLSYINGYSHAEVAEFLEVPLTTVRSRLRHAKHKLREEMIEMVEDVLHEDKPGEELARKILDAKRVYRALILDANDEALRYCDDALAAIHDLSISKTPDQFRELLVRTVESAVEWPGNKEQALQQLRTWPVEQIKLRQEADILVRKGEALLRMHNVEGANELFEQAIELVKSIDSRDPLTALTERISHHYHNYHYSGLARKYLSLVVEAARETGDVFKEAMNTWALANSYMDDAQPAEARPLYERAQALFDQAGLPARAVMSQAAVDLIDEVGESDWASIVHCMALCIATKKSGSSTEVTDQGGGWTSRPCDYPWQPMAIGGLGTILDASLPVGHSWQEGESWLTDGPLKVTHSILGYDEAVAISGAQYSGCLLIETLTVENKLPDSMSDEMKARLRSNTGSIRKWYAPGIGLVRLVARNDSGYEAVIELADSEIVERSTDYLPLAVGNSWTYIWVDAPQGYTAKERCRVAANDGDYWFLENYRYVLK